MFFSKKIPGFSQNVPLFLKMFHVSQNVPLFSEKVPKKSNILKLSRLTQNISKQISNILKISWASPRNAPKKRKNNNAFKIARFQGINLFILFFKKLCYAYFTNLK
jgi:hypothetical protein